MTVTQSANPSSFLSLLYFHGQYLKTTSSQKFRHHFQIHQRFITNTIQFSFFFSPNSTSTQCDSGMFTYCNPHSLLQRLRKLTYQLLVCNSKSLTSKLPCHFVSLHCTFLKIKAMSASCLLTASTAVEIDDSDNLSDNYWYISKYKVIINCPQNKKNNAANFMDIQSQQVLSEKEVRAFIFYVSLTSLNLYFPTYYQSYMGIYLEQECTWF